MKNDIQGCSTCQKGQENYERFMAKGKEYVQYDYRDLKGNLFSCVDISLEACRKHRDNWILKNNIFPE